MRRTKASWETYITQGEGIKIPDHIIVKYVEYPWVTCFGGGRDRNHQRGNATGY